MLMLGSCFSTAIGQRLKEDKYSVEVNPMGILYNPGSMAHWLRFGLEGAVPDPFEVEGERWFSFWSHSDLHGESRAALDRRLQEAAKHLHKAIKEADWLFLTWGTAWAYRHKASQRIVGNNHKQPGHLFERELLQVETLAGGWQGLLEALFQLNPRLQVVMTVSPVKHLRDGLMENHLSKSILRSSIYALEQVFGDKLQYFPSFELLTEELRDYRYYADDMSHPSREAEEYIYQRFLEVFQDETDRPIFEQWQKAKALLNHRPRFPGSAAHQKMQAQLKALLEELRESLDVEEAYQDLNGCE